MDQSATESPIDPPAGGDDIRVRPWFAVFAVYLVTVVVLLFVLLPELGQFDHSSWSAVQTSVLEMSGAIKLTVFVLYLSLASTFLPLNTGWIASAVAIRPGVTGEFFSTVLVVSLLGAMASTMANLTDYHLFTLALRSKRIAKIRHARFYAAAERWFARSPWTILLVINALPIPLDPSRVLAASHQYSRRRFATANFLGRFIRYSVIAAATFLLGQAGWVVTVGLLGVAMVVVLARLFKRKSKPGEPPCESSEETCC
jgi:membrane protein YqaA with SNARE-associated domain